MLNESYKKLIVKLDDAIQTRPDDFKVYVGTNFRHMKYFTDSKSRMNCNFNHNYIFFTDENLFIGRDDVSGPEFDRIIIFLEDRLQQNLRAQEEFDQNVRNQSAEALTRKLDNDSEAFGYIEPTDNKPGFFQLLYNWWTK